MLFYLIRFVTYLPMIQGSSLYTSKVEDDMLPMFSQLVIVGSLPSTITLWRVAGYCGRQP